MEFKPKGFPGTTRIELNSTSWSNGNRAVFFSIFSGKDFKTHISFTTDEAREFGQALINEANHIDTHGYVKGRKEVKV